MQPDDSAPPKQQQTARNNEHHEGHVYHNHRIGQPKPEHGVIPSRMNRAMPVYGAVHNAAISSNTGVSAYRYWDTISVSLRRVHITAKQAFPDCFARQSA